MADAVRWWQRGTIYQIYPRSFQDTNGDGVGDLPGIIERLDYLHWLGVDAVWLSPIYPSPMADFGYDVSDYTAIDPVFGTLDDLDRLVEHAHALGLKVILDYVPNHSSDQHPWFQAARSSRDDPHRDWYIWRDPAPDGGPPNNWQSTFGGSAWTWDARTGQYYYHAFLPEQPDLNWHNPELRAAMLDVLRFWLDRGVDGFRVDVISQLIKDPDFRDNPPHPDDPDGLLVFPLYSRDLPEVHTVIAEMRRTLDEYPDRLLIGEAYLPIDRLMAYYGTNGGGVHIPFNFQLILRPWRAEVVAATIREYEAALPVGGWPNWVLGNHDQRRVATRIGAAQARVAAMLLLTLRGTPTLYYGDEIGMYDVAIPPERMLDPVAHRLGPSEGRDPARTPMQWDATTHAGFTDGEPWLPIPRDAREINVAREREDPRSMLTLHRRLLALRRAEPALQIGRLDDVEDDGDLVTYTRTDGKTRFRVLLNLGHEARRYAPASGSLAGAVVISTYLDREDQRVQGQIDLRADEGLVVRLDAMPGTSPPTGRHT